MMVEGENLPIDVRELWGGRGWYLCISTYVYYISGTLGSSVTPKDS